MIRSLITAVGFLAFHGRGQLTAHTDSDNELESDVIPTPPTPKPVALNAGDGGTNLESDVVPNWADGQLCKNSGEYDQLTAMEKLIYYLCDECNNPATVWSSLSGDNDGAYCDIDGCYGYYGIENNGESPYQLACGTEPANQAITWLANDEKCFNRVDGQIYSANAINNSNCNNCLNGWDFHEDQQYRCGESGCFSKGKSCKNSNTVGNGPWCSHCCKGKVRAFWFFGGWLCK